jgi:hypothetical protein
MDAAIWGVLAALVAVIAASGIAVGLSLKLGDARGDAADLRIKVNEATEATEDEKRERGVAIARAERYLADLEDYRRRAQAELATLRADLEKMADAPHILDPASRRAQWGRLLAKADAVRTMLEHDPGAARADAAGGELLRGLDGGQPAPGAAGGVTDRPGTRGPAA